MQNGTSLADLATTLVVYKPQIIQGLVGLPIGGALIGQVLTKIRERPGAWFLSAVVHTAVFLIIPPATVLLYLLLGTSTNLFTDIDVVMYFAPIFSGLLTLFLVPQVMPLDDIPGFDRIRGLVGLATMTTMIIWFMSRMRFVGMFWITASVGNLLCAALGVFLVLRYFMGKVMSPGRQPRMDELLLED